MLFKLNTTITNLIEFFFQYKVKVIEYIIYYYFENLMQILCKDDFILQMLRI